MILMKSWASMWVNETVVESVHKFLNKIRWFFLKTDQNHIYYIGGSEILPPPLTLEEEKELMEKMKEEFYLI